MKLPDDYQEAKEKLEIMHEELIEQIQILQQRMITLEEGFTQKYYG